MIIAGVSVVLILMALVFGGLWKRDKIPMTAVMLLVFLGFGFYLSGRDALASPYWKESNYYSIRYFDQPGDNAEQ